MRLIAISLFVVTLSLFAHAELNKTESKMRDENSILLTIFLKHDQSMNVDENQKVLEEQGFYKSFPPKGTSVVNWYVMMGIGQVVILEVPASKLREVNLAIEKTAWKAFQTEFYPTYDLYPVVKGKLENKSTVSD
jgi:hypothetical protein